MVTDTLNKASGYWVRYDPKRKYVVAKHQLILEKKMGRRLKPHERVHHIDGNKSNCKMSNLKVVTQSEHNKLHGVWKGKKNPSKTMSPTELSKRTKKGWRTRIKNERRK